MGLAHGSGVIQCSGVPHGLGMLLGSGSGKWFGEVARYEMAIAADCLPSLQFTEGVGGGIVYGTMKRR